MEALLTLDTIVPCPMSWFIQLVVMFHIGEFMATALFSSATLRQSSFLLNHSREGESIFRLCRTDTIRYCGVKSLALVF